MVAELFLGMGGIPAQVKTCSGGGLCVSSLPDVHHGSAWFLHVSCSPRSFSKLGWGSTIWCRRDCFAGSQDTFMCPAVVKPSYSLSSCFSSSSWMSRRRASMEGDSPCKGGKVE